MLLVGVHEKQNSAAKYLCVPQSFFYRYDNSEMNPIWKPTLATHGSPCLKLEGTEARHDV